MPDNLLALIVVLKQPRSLHCRSFSYTVSHYKDLYNWKFLSIGMPGPGRSPFPTIGMSASWKASLWTRIEKLTDHICKIYGQVIVEIYPPTLSIYVCNKYLVRNICYFH